MKIEDIEKLCAEASPSPWVIKFDHGRYRLRHSQESNDSDLLQRPQLDCFPERIEDARFISKARELIPKLLAIAKAVEDHIIRINAMEIWPIDDLEKALKDLERE